MEPPAEVSLPSLGQVAPEPVHPLAPYAPDNLRLFLGEDFSVETADWEAVLKGLKETPQSAPEKQPGQNRR